MPEGKVARRRVPHVSICTPPLTPHRTTVPEVYIDQDVLMEEAPESQGRGEPACDSPADFPPDFWDEEEALGADDGRRGDPSLDGRSGDRTSASRRGHAMMGPVTCTGRGTRVKSRSPRGGSHPGWDRSPLGVQVDPPDKPTSPLLSPPGGPSSSERPPGLDVLNLVRRSQDQQKAGADLSL